MNQDFLQFRQDPKNFKWGLVYYCPQDPCVILPKRNQAMGWTINFAHQLAFPVLFFAFFLGVAPSLVFVASVYVFELSPVLVPIVAMLGAIVASVLLVSIAKKLSNRPLHTEK